MIPSTILKGKIWRKKENEIFFYTYYEEDTPESSTQNLPEEAKNAPIPETVAWVAV